MGKADWTITVSNRDGDSQTRVSGGGDGDEASIGVALWYALDGIAPRPLSALADAATCGGDGCNQLTEAERRFMDAAVELLQDWERRDQERDS